MTFLPQQSPLNLGLAAFAGTGLCLLVVVTAPSWVRLEGYDRSNISPLLIIPPKPLRQGPFEGFAPIIEHPLFNSDRAKDPALPPLSQLQLPSLDSYRLVGVVVSADKSVALVERLSTKTVLELKEGDDLDGRTIQYVTESGLTFLGSDETLAMPKVTGAAFVSPDAAAPSANNSDASTNIGAVGDRDKK